MRRGLAIKRRGPNDVEIYTRYQRGDSSGSLSREFGITVNKLFAIVQREARIHGDILRPHVNHNCRFERNEAIFNSYQDGMSAIELSKEYGITKQRVLQLVVKECRKRGVAIRPKLRRGNNIAPATIALR